MCVGKGIGRGRGWRRNETRARKRRERGRLGHSKGDSEWKGKKKFDLELYLEEGTVKLKFSLSMK